MSYSYCDENSKILYSYRKRRIAKSFAGRLFNRHRLLFETGQLQNDFSNLYYFLPSITDRSELINQHMNSVNLIPIDISEETFEIEDGVAFDPSKLDISWNEKKLMANSFLKMLKIIAHISNHSIVINFYQKNPL